MTARDSAVEVRVPRLRVAAAPRYAGNPRAQERLC